MSQYIPNEAVWEQDGETVLIRLTQDHQLESHHRPENLAYELKIDVKQPREFGFRLRLPWWVSGKPEFRLNGEPLEIEKDPAGYLQIRRIWENDILHLVFPKKLNAVPLPGESEMQAFMDGPVVLAGLNPMPGYPVAQEDDITDARVQPQHLVRGISLTGDPAQPETILIPDNEWEWWFWNGSYRTRGQDQNIRFIPLHEIRNEIYTVYFPIKKGV